MYDDPQYTIAEITAETGVPKATIYDWRNKAGLPLNRLGTKPMQAGRVDTATLIEELARTQQALGVALSDLERERQITRWFLERTLLDPAALARELEASTRKPARPRKG